MRADTIATRIGFLKIYVIAIAFVFLFSFPTSLSATSSNELQSQPQYLTDPKASETPGAQISGHVYRADSGAPLPKAIVTITSTSANSTRQERATRTSADGSFSFTAVVPGTYGFRASRPGFVSGTYSVESSRPGVNVYSFTIKPAQVFNNIEFRLSPAGVISGMVTDEDGDAAGGVVVAAVRPDYSPGGCVEESSEKTTVTDDRGSFRLVGLVPGDYFVRAGGFVATSDQDPPKSSWKYERVYFPNVNRMDAAETVKVAAGAEITSINLRVLSASQNLYMIKGKILGPSGEPTDYGQMISLIHGEEMDNNAGQVLADGTLMIPGVAPGKYTVLAESWDMNQNPERLRLFSNDMHFGESQVTVDNADVSIVLQLVAAGYVHGKLVVEGDAKSEFDDFSSADVELQPESGIGNLKDDSDSKVEANGTFSIRRLSPGDYWLSADLKGTTSYLKQVLCNDKNYTLEPITIELAAALDCQVTLRMDAATISGKVLDGDKPIPGFIVIAIPESHPLRRAPYNTQAGRTSSSGQFLLSGLAPGDYLLFAVPRDDQERYYTLDFADRNQRDSARVTVKPNETKTLTLKPIVPQ